jgi:hypothetical protein
MQSHVGQGQPCSVARSLWESGNALRGLPNPRFPGLDWQSGWQHRTIIQTMNQEGNDVPNGYVRRVAGRNVIPRSSRRGHQCLLASAWARGPFPGMVLIHHAPGWGEWYREATRKFLSSWLRTVLLISTIADGHGTPEDVAAKIARRQGHSRRSSRGRCRGAMHYLRASVS